jgi:hypothetical protein
MGPPGNVSVLSRVIDAADEVVRSGSFGEVIVDGGKGALEGSLVYFHLKGAGPIMAYHLSTFRRRVTNWRESIIESSDRGSFEARPPHLLHELVRRLRNPETEENSLT